MFPDIIRDEVFRIESRRLWLRWPQMADAFDADPPMTGRPAGPVGEGYGLPAAACIAAWRADAERGSALHLMLEEKAEGRPVLGIIHLTAARDGAMAIDFRLAPNRRGEGLMTEALQALIHTAFLMQLASAVSAAPAAADQKGRDVLERCGFTYLGSGMRPAPGAGLAACDNFRLDRRTWVSLQGWGLSGRPPLGPVAPVAGPGTSPACP
ncbi:GNAT family protein [Lichenihabitans sp. Uapishka_5]|uniref:GNAT family N-acetyltransferase n=1 Tax=Lichenihabitans sp. Uapishka_5 TaxID=3037302 RepID=UPI0029E7E68C|nr:GNAT family protein [Lichenihabitans sp. Uapishka_5]MDX7952732.1 GNAT family protein [Lichenihabitans sp. Uapishka_5]